MTRQGTLVDMKEVLDNSNLAVTNSIFGKRIGLLAAIFTSAYFQSGILELWQWCMEATWDVWG